MKDKARSLKIDVCPDFSSLEDMKNEYEKIIDRINLHLDGLEDAINDFKDYKPNLEMTYSVAAPSKKSCQGKENR